MACGTLIVAAGCVQVRNNWLLDTMKPYPVTFFGSIED
jgi:hypothetical protein